MDEWEFGDSGDMKMYEYEATGEVFDQLSQQIFQQSEVNMKFLTPEKFLQKRQTMARILNFAFQFSFSSWKSSLCYHNCLSSKEMNSRMNFFILKKSSIRINQFYAKMCKQRPEILKIDSRHLGMIFWELWAW